MNAVPGPRDPDGFRFTQGRMSLVQRPVPRSEVLDYKVFGECFSSFFFFLSYKICARVPDECDRFNLRLLHALTLSNPCLSKSRSILGKLRESFGALCLSFVRLQ